MNDLEMLLGHALQASVADESLDLDRLASRSLGQGRRQRTRRRVGAAVGAFAAVAVIGAGLAALDGGGRGESDVASDPVTAMPSPSPSKSPGRPSVTFPVRLDLPGWSCKVTAVDAKATCTSRRDGGSVALVVRDADERDEFVSSPDKAGRDDFVSKVHGNFFVTASGDFGRVSPQRFGRALVYGTRWDPPSRQDGDMTQWSPAPGATRDDFPVRETSDKWECRPTSSTAATCRNIDPTIRPVRLEVAGPSRVDRFLNEAHDPYAFVRNAGTRRDYALIVDGGPVAPALDDLMSSLEFGPPAKKDRKP